MAVRAKTKPDYKFDVVTVAGVPFTKGDWNEVSLSEALEAKILNSPLLVAETVEVKVKAKPAKKKTAKKPKTVKKVSSSS